jgi:WD40 repeat protein
MISPDGKTLATINSNDAVGLWDVTTGQQIGPPLTGDGYGVTAVTFTPDGKTLATSSLGPAQLWDVSYLMDPAKYLCESQGFSPNRTEWARYIPPSLPYERICF